MTNTFLQDWGHPFDNIDRETQIHYGVISNNSVSQEALDVGGLDWNNDSFDAYMEDAEKTWEAMRDEDDESEYDGQEAADAYMSDEDEYSYKADGYEIISCLDNDWMIIKSPFYTFAAPCSPC